MSDLIKYIIDVFDDFPALVQVLFIFLLGGFVFFGYNFVKNDSFRKSFITLIFRSCRALNNKTSLLNHDLFYKEKILKKMIQSIHYTSEIKTELFRILLNCKVESAIGFAKSFVRNFDSSLSVNELYMAFFNNMYEIIEKYESAILNQFCYLHGEEKGKKLYFIIYDQLIVGFKAKHDENVRFITKTIEKVSRSKAFSSKQKCYLYLNQIEMALELAITDCEATFELLNGEIDRIVKS